MTSRRSGAQSEAFATHPRVQRDTEAIINHVFAIVSGYEWDVGSGAPGLSRRAVEAILGHCPDQEISSDVTWPLCLQQLGGYSFGYMETEGLEFETGDRYREAIAHAGGAAHWQEQLDADPQRWLHRLDLARLEVEAMVRHAERLGKPPAAPASGQ